MHVRIPLPISLMADQCRHAAARSPERDAPKHARVRTEYRIRKLSSTGRQVVPFQHPHPGGAKQYLNTALQSSPEIRGLLEPANGSPSRSYSLTFGQPSRERYKYTDKKHCWTFGLCFARFTIAAPRGDWSSRGGGGEIGSFLGQNPPTIRVRVSEIRYQDEGKRIKENYAERPGGRRSKTWYNFHIASIVRFI